MAHAQPEPYTSANHYKYTAGGWFYQYQLRRFLHRVYEMVAATRPRTVLDAGCGEGFVTSYIKEQDSALRLTGVDVSASAIAYARAHHNGQARFQTGTIYDLPFADNSFDTVLCSEVLEHLEAPERATRELRRVACSSVVVTVPREPYFDWLIGLGQRLGVSPDPGHVNFWTKSDFQDFIHAHYEDASFDWVHLFQLAVAKV